MKKVLYFHLDTCPYCKQADSVLAELVAEDPVCAAVEFEKETNVKKRKARPASTTVRSFTRLRRKAIMSSPR